MKTLLLNGSPKPKQSASGAILDYLRAKLPAGSQADAQIDTQIDAQVDTQVDAQVDAQVECCDILRQKAEDILAAAKDADAIVISFPLYVDSLPSHVVGFLEEVESKLARVAAPGARVYAIVNNGFYEASQNRIAARMLKRFAGKAGLEWGQALLVGAGGMLGAAQIGAGPFVPLGRALDALAGNIAARKSAADAEVLPSIPRFLYFHAANFGMKAQAKQNGVRKL